jgi:hypothetical protein
VARGAGLEEFRLRLVVTLLATLQHRTHRNHSETSVGLDLLEPRLRFPLYGLFSIRFTFPREVDGQENTPMMTRISGTIPPRFRLSVAWDQSEHVCAPVGPSH